MILFCKYFVVLVLVLLVGSVFYSVFVQVGVVVMLLLVCFDVYVLYNMMLGVICVGSCIVVVGVYGYIIFFDDGGVSYCQVDKVLVDIMLILVSFVGIE